jgi:acyl-CoA oxidase
LPGIRTGDLGPKLGYQSKDNGWATFTQVRIPRTNMLMRISELSKSGEFSIKGDPRVLYTTMMVIRLNIVTDVQTLNFLSCLIALRYASVRR